jgi:hypothetical protein
MLVGRCDLDPMVTERRPHVHRDRFRREIFARAPIDESRADEPCQYCCGAPGSRAAKQPAPPLARYLGGGIAGRCTHYAGAQRGRRAIDRNLRANARTQCKHGAARRRAIRTGSQMLSDRLGLPPFDLAISIGDGKRGCFVAIHRSPRAA